MRFDHATGLCGGMLVVNGRKSPSASSLAKLGNFPSRMNRCRSCGSIPSMPRMISRRLVAELAGADRQDGSIATALTSRMEHSIQGFFFREPILGVPCSVVTRFQNTARLLRMLRSLGPWSLLAILPLLVSPVDSSGTTKPNIILITLDSTRVDRLGFLGARGSLTPNLDGLAHQGIVFAQAYAQAPTTVVSAATILTGTYPQTHQASEFGTPLPATLPYLPALLHASGYRTAAFVGSILLDPRNGPYQGYD